MWLVSQHLVKNLQNVLKNLLPPRVVSGNEILLNAEIDTAQHFILIQEDITKGERIRQCMVEAEVDGTPKTAVTKAYR